MFVLTLNAFRQRCFHNFQHPRKFIARLFDSRLCSWCVTFPFFYIHIYFVCNFLKLIRLNLSPTEHNLFWLSVIMAKTVAHSLNTFFLAFALKTIFFFSKMAKSDNGMAWTFIHHLSWTCFPGDKKNMVKTSQVETFKCSHFFQQQFNFFNINLIWSFTNSISFFNTFVNTNTRNVWLRKHSTLNWTTNWNTRISPRMLK